MAKIPEPLLRRILVDALTVAVPDAQVPTSIVSVARIVLPLAPPRAFDVAVRTITRDTREAGKWEDRLKIQLTSLKGIAHVDAILGLTVIGDEPLIVSIDPGDHIPTIGSSNSVQFPEALVLEALATQQEVTHRKDNGELVRAFPSSLLVPFLLRRAVSPAATPTLPEATYRTYRARTRSSAFSPAIRALFRHRCAVCGVALGLVEAAHILPHAMSGDDSEANGLCLCPTHHAAFDTADLLSFSSDRTIWINTAKLELLESRGLMDGAHLVLATASSALTPVDVNQSAQLQERHSLDREDGAWAPRHDLTF